MKLMLRFLVLFSFLSLGFVARAAADDVADAKQRMIARQGEVATLKTSGAVGENNRGFLEVRGQAGNAASVVAAENQDRQVLYAEVARRAGTSAEEAGRARARQIFAQSAPGVWVQREDGTWQKK
jgi:uncharacterized protein YdbL (DUF1318 family)